MERYFGTSETSLLEVYNPIKNKWILRYDVQQLEEDNISFLSHVFDHKPTMSEIKNVILSHTNSQIDKSILEGFEWNRMKVWLSAENQFNYKAAYDLAVQTEGKNLPIVFKFGTTDEPVYYKFDDIETLADFYTRAMTYINVQLATGWAKKDAIDWTPYEKILNNNGNN